MRTAIAKGIRPVGREDQGRELEIDRARIYGAEQVEAIPVVAGRARVSGTQISPVWDLEARERKESFGKK